MAENEKKNYGGLVVSILLAIILVGALYWYMNNDSGASEAFALESSVFENSSSIPQLYTCDGGNISPPLSIKNVPEGTQSLVIVMEDPDVPKELRPDGLFVHWVLYAMPPDTKDIPENSIAGDTGLNGAGNDSYTGPCPPPNYQPTEHRYFFHLYALDNTPTFVKTPTKEELMSAIEDHVIKEVQLMGRYQRPSGAATTTSQE